MDSNNKFLDYGINIFKSKVFSTLPEIEFLDLSNIQEGLSQHGKLQGLFIEEPYYEVGSDSGIVDFSRYLIEKGPQ